MFKKIAFTGGACGGKSTIINIISDELKCIVAPEPAWIVFGLQQTLGFKFDSVDRQHLIFNLHLLFEYWAEENVKNNEIILMDRTIVDNSVFTKEEQYLYLLKRYGVDKIKIIDNYSAVIYCESIAHSNPEEFLIMRPFADIEKTKQIDLDLLEAYKNCNNLILLNDCSLNQRVNKVRNILMNKFHKTSSIHEIIDEKSLSLLIKDSRLIMQKYNISNAIQENIISPNLRNQENYLDIIHNL